MQAIATIGLDIANQLFKCTGFKMVAKWLSAGIWSVVYFWAFFSEAAAMFDWDIRQAVTRRL